VEAPSGATLAQMALESRELCHVASPDLRPAGHKVAPRMRDAAAAEVLKGQETICVYSGH
jgi:hypothetical protein